MELVNVKYNEQLLFEIILSLNRTAEYEKQVR